MAKETSVKCDFCDSTIVKDSREVTVTTSGHYGPTTLTYDLCRDCYVTGTTHRDTFKRIWSKVTGRPYVAQHVTEKDGENA